ncbi:LysR family transcriptional regulator, partial [Mitsuaria sp. TWR114]
AVTVLTRTAVPDDLEILEEAHGLPPLPAVALTLAFDRERPTPLTAAFAAHVRKFLPTA